MRRSIAAFNRRLRPAVWSEVVEGKVVIGVAVPEARPADKPNRRSERYRLTPAGERMKLVTRRGGRR